MKLCEIAKDSLLRHNRRNEFVIRDIECGIVHVYAFWCHAFFVPHVGDFLGGRCSMWMSAPVGVFLSMVEVGAQT